METVLKLIAANKKKVVALIVMALGYLSMKYADVDLHDAVCGEQPAPIVVPSK